MTINPKAIPVGTLVEATHHGHTGFQPIEATDFTLRDVEVVRAFVPVPDGMTVEDAAQALADHVQWVPLPDGVQKEHIGARLRCEFEGVATEGKSHSTNVNGIWTVLGGQIGEGLRNESWFIHPDDVPTDPDAELVQQVADAVAVRIQEGKVVAQTHAAYYRDVARAALAVVREHEAGTR